MNEKLLPEITKQSHPEHFCDKCGGKNLLSWYADSDEWNKIVGDDYSILCPICFAEIADEKGLRPTAWRLSREGDSPEIDKLRIRIHELLFARQPELNLQEVEKAVQGVSELESSNAATWGKTITQESIAEEYRNAIGYTLPDLEVKGGKYNKADLTERLVDQIMKVVYQNGDWDRGDDDPEIYIKDSKLRTAIEKTLSE